MRKYLLQLIQVLDGSTITVLTSHVCVLSQEWFTVHAAFGGDPRLASEGGQMAERSLPQVLL